jgi:hypothetical protein
MGHLSSYLLLGSLCFLVDVLLSYFSSACQLPQKEKKKVFREEKLKSMGYTAQ